MADRKNKKPNKREPSEDLEVSVPNMEEEDSHTPRRRSTGFVDKSTATNLKCTPEISSMLSLDADDEETMPIMG